MSELRLAVKYLPRWLPGTSFLDYGEMGYKQIDNFVTRPFEHVKREMVCCNSKIVPLLTT